VPKDVIGLVTTRADVSKLLELDDVIDLCIPRGSSELVRSIKVGALWAKLRSLLLVALPFDRSRMIRE
jgi:gamma-glutamyl phosphate reductase